MSVRPADNVIWEAWQQAEHDRYSRQAATVGLAVLDLTPLVQALLADRAAVWRAACYACAKEIGLGNAPLVAALTRLADAPPKEVVG